MNIVFLDSGTIGEDIDVGVFSKLGSFTEYKKTSPEQTAERIENADVVIANKVKLTAEVLAHAKRLSLVCVTATGYDNVDIEYAKKNEIAVCNVKGYSTDSVAQVTAACVLSLVNHIGEYDRYCKSGKYTESGVQNMLNPVFYELSGKVWGIYGFGNIGRKVAEIAKSFGCGILVCKRTPDADFNCVSLSELFEKCDIITIHTPLTSETLHSVNEEMLSKSKKNLVLVNAARGAVTDEKAVAEAVLSGKIGAFAADVYSSEPLEEASPLCALKKCENVIFTPHMAWGAYEARERLIDEVYKNISDFQKGGRRNRVI